MDWKNANPVAKKYVLNPAMDVHINVRDALTLPVSIVYQLRKAYAQNAQENHP